ncbi:MAG: 6-phosphogluconolactonase [Rhodospirillales bacterium]
MRRHDYSDDGACDAALAAALADTLQKTLSEKPRVTLALSGGRSPARVLPLLAAQPIDWARVDVTLVDERRVGIDHADSNAGLVRRHFLEAGADTATMHPLWCGTLSVAEALSDTDRRLKSLLPADVAYLGMGPDGHIASLFPEADPAAFESAASSVIATEAPSPPHERISMTLRCILEMPRLFLHAGGAEKRHVLEQVAAHPPSAAVPVSLLVHARPDLEVFVCG